MKKGIVLSVREGTDKKTNESQVWVVVGKFPTKNKDSGKIFAPLASETVISVCAGKESKPDKYERYKSLTIGSIVDIFLSVNDVTDKTYVDNLLLAVESPFNEDDIFVL